MTVNNRIVAREFGLPARVLECENSPRPKPSAGRLLVRMIASPINPSDLIPVTGAYRHRTTLPFVPGFEGVGRVVEGEDGSEQHPVGARVLPLDGPGCWQEWRIADAERCVMVPDDITDAEAATSYINPLTALLMLDILSPQPGERIGITAAGSAIGRMLVRLLAARGAEPVAIVRRLPPDHDELRHLGEVRLEGACLPVLDGGFDAVGGRAAGYLAAAIRPAAPLLHYGLLSGVPLREAGNARLRLFRLRDHTQRMNGSELRSALGKCFEEIRAGHARSKIAKRVPIANFQDALALNSRRGRTGKIILCMNQGDGRVDHTTP